MEKQNVGPLHGKKVLVIEDEALVAVMLEDMLMDMGAEVVGPLMTLERAHAFVNESFEVDCALLDVNVGGKEIFPVADVLIRRNVPVVFATGYGVSGLPDSYQRHATVPKPMTYEQLASAITACIRLPSPQA